MNKIEFRGYYEFAKIKDEKDFFSIENILIFASENEIGLKDSLFNKQLQKIKENTE